MNTMILYFGLINHSPHIQSYENHSSRQTPFTVQMRILTVQSEIESNHTAAVYFYHMI
jgi:hypothetical protein